MTKTKFLQNYFEKALELVIASQHCSTSYLMRKLGLDYDTATLMVDFMEESGVIDSHKGPYPRKVLISNITV